ncbi:MAG: BrnT family toxin [Verrucomicrobia bacterium]|nr:BrnT family toxin [Verrucomicrobiota bacterium]
MDRVTFEWDPRKDETNIAKHGVSFFIAQQAFLDPRRIIAEDIEHSRSEKRYYCFGKIDGVVMTVRFTFKGDKIRIFGAGYWRKGRKIYEKAQN